MRNILILATAAILTGCKVGPDYRAPRSALSALSCSSLNTCDDWIPNSAKWRASSAMYSKHSGTAGTIDKVRLLALVKCSAGLAAGIDGSTMQK